MTFVPTFSYGNSPVYFGLYYDREKDVNVEAGSLNMNLYFNNSLENSASSSGASSVSLKMPSELYMEYYMQKIPLI